MPELLHRKRLVQSPTLNTVMMVEDTLKRSKGSIASMAEIKRRLPRQINHNMLKIILQYLESSNKIAVSLKGITWIHNTNQNLKKAIHQGLE